MIEKTASFIDKSTWARGPWDDEPDRLEWRMPDLPYPCLIVRGPSGALCGYVGVPPGHPAHGKDWNELDAIDAHGGLSYSRPCQAEHGCPTEGLICHEPEPGETDNVWWLGFDCAHSGDVMPATDARVREATGRSFSDTLNANADMGALWRITYKPVPYVRAEVEDLARQLAALK